jgi:SAM-dependent methyltransferase
MQSSTVSAWTGRYRFDVDRRVFFPQESAGTDVYTDGDEFEERLGAILRSATDLSVFSEELARSISDWGTQYHLSALRANLLRPLRRLVTGRVLEIGAGCGAVTRFLGECGAEVIALEPSPRRASLAAMRCRDLPNVSVVCDRADRFPTERKFDLVTLIGVLEWARRFGAGEDPIRTLLRQAAALLADGGALVVAIENQLGLKYLAGAPEDHVGVPMWGINDLYDATSPVTFGREELFSLIGEAGLAAVSLFVPLPDYKGPTTIITPTGLKDSSWRDGLANLLTASPAQDPQPAVPLAISLEQAWNVVARNGLLPELANSFLVVAAKSDADLHGKWSPATLAVHYSHGRRRQFLREVVLERSGQSVRVVSSRLSPGDVEDPLPITMHVASQPYHEGRLWTQRLGAVLNRPGWKAGQIAAWARPWLDAVLEKAGRPALQPTTLVPGNLIDATPFNLIEEPGGSLVFIDAEWETTGSVELGFLVFRSLYYTLGRCTSVAAPDPEVPVSLGDLIAEVTSHFGFWLSSAELRRYAELEMRVQSWVTGATRDSNVDAMLQRGLVVRPGLATAAQVAALEADLRTRTAELQDLRQTRESLDTALQEERARRDELTRALESRGEDERRLLEEERALRERMVRELDSEARSLADRLSAVTARLDDQRTWVQRGMEHASGLVAARKSWFARSGTTLGAMPAIVAMALRSGGWRSKARVLVRLARHPRRLREAALVSRSGLFDEPFYVSSNPDVGRAGVHPFLHYVLWGAFEGRNPHPLFDPAFYLERSPDVARMGLEPLAHFLLHGGIEERNPGPDFDARFYLTCNPDVRDAGLNPLVHFARFGWREGRNPSASFDVASYLARYEEVQSSGVNPLVHYVETGRRLGLDPSAATDAPVSTPSRVRLVPTPLTDHRPDRPLLVCLTHVCPWPPHAGNSYRIHRLLLQLQRDGYQIVPVIVPLGGEMPDAASIRKVEEIFSNVVVVDRDGAIRYTLRDVPDVLASLAGEHTPRYSALLGEEGHLDARARELLVIERTYCPDAAVSALLRLHSALGRYVLLTEYVWLTRVLPLIDDRAVKVIDTHDVYSLKADKVLRHGVRDLWLRPEEEADRLRLADLVIAIQEDEREILHGLVPTTPVVTAGVDFDVVGDPKLPDGHRVLFIGSGNAMNVRGLKEFLRFTWPFVRERVPDAELLVAGDVSQAIGEEPPGVRALGRVEDLGALYRMARVIINPTIAGTGIKIKTIEALTYYRPIVTWPTGVDGLPQALKDLCDVVEDWYEFGARIASRLVNVRDEAFTAAERTLIEQVTSPNVVYAGLSSALRELWERRGARDQARAGGA